MGEQEGDVQNTQTVPQTSQNTSGDSGKSLGIVGLLLSFFFPPAGLIVSIIARSKSKKNGFKNGLATAGIVLSIVFMLLGVATVTAVTVTTVNAIKAPLAVSGTFVDDLLAGNTSAAYGNTSSEFQKMYTQQQFDQAIANVSQAGLKKQSTTNTSINSDNGVTTATIVYDAQSNEGNYSITVNLVKENGQWKVLNFESKRQ